MQTKKEIHRYQQLTSSISIPKVEAAYVAAIIDGEGTITLGRWKKKKKYWLIHPRIYITNQNKQLLGIIKNLFGNRGYIIVHKSKSSYSDNICYRLYVSGLSVAPILKTLIPYLRLKREQGKLVYEFCIKRLNKGVNTKYSDDEWYLFRKVREYNSSGGKLHAS